MFTFCTDSVCVLNIGYFIGAVLYTVQYEDSTRSVHVIIGVLLLRSTVPYTVSSMNSNFMEHEVGEQVRYGIFSLVTSEKTIRATPRCYSVNNGQHEEFVLLLSLMCSC